MTGNQHVVTYTNTETPTMHEGADSQVVVTADTPEAAVEAVVEMNAGTEVTVVSVETLPTTEK